MPITQDWGSVNVGSGAAYKKPTTALGIDAAKQAGKIATEKRWVPIALSDPMESKHLAHVFYFVDSL